MSDRPNLLFVMSDQHRADAMGCAGHSVVSTPNLDDLAADGVRFTNAYTQSPLCVPARASMYAGVYPHNVQVRDFGSWVPADVDTFFHRLQEEGYYTAHIGEADQKAWLTTDDDGDVRDNRQSLESLGFDYVHETIDPWQSRTLDSPVTDYWEERGLLETVREDLQERWEQAREYDHWEEGGFSVNWPAPVSAEDHLDGYTCRQAIEFIEQYDREEPFALFVGIPGPHEPMDPPPEFAELYDPAEMPDPIPPHESPEWVSDDVAEFVESEIGHVPESYDIEQYREVQAAYFAKITHIDHWIGELVETLDAEGLRRETLTVYTSDHGELHGDHARVAKHCFFEGSVGIPMIVSRPGEVPQGETSDALVELIDLYPTALDAAGERGRGTTFGESLLTPASSPDDPDAVSRNLVCSIFEERTMICTPQYKYAVDGEGQGYLLFDREADPDERENLLGHPEYDDVERQLRDELLRFLAETCSRYRRDGDGYRIADPGS